MERIGEIEGPNRDPMLAGDLAEASDHILGARNRHRSRAVYRGDLESEKAAAADQRLRLVPGQAGRGHRAKPMHLFLMFAAIEDDVDSLSQTDRAGCLGGRDLTNAVAEHRV